MNKHTKKILRVAGIGVVLIAILLWMGTLGTTVQIIGGILLVLILPGYALTTALFGRTIGRPEQLLFTLMGSFGIMALGSLILNRTPWRLSFTGWLILIVAAVAVGGIATFVLRNHTKFAEVRSLRMRLGVMQTALLVAAVVVAGIAINLAQIPAPAAGYEGYTMLWMLPDYTAAATGGGRRIELGIDSKEFTATAYKLQIKIDDDVAQEWPAITLNPNEQWKATFAVSPEQLRQNNIRAELYLNDMPETVYRRVVLRPTND
ncbi:MAG: DUF1616 domain-containing protein [Caldilineaceae bacterium]